MDRLTIGRSNKQQPTGTAAGNLASNPPKKKAPLQRVVLLFFSAVFLISALASILLPAATQAASLNSKSSLKEQVSAYATYNAMLDCLGQDSQQADSYGFVLSSWRTTDGHLKSGDWWRTSGDLYWGTTQGAESSASYLNKDVKKDSGNTLCNDIVKAAAPIFGYSSVFKFACSFIDVRANGSSCETGTGDFKEFSSSVDKFKSVMTKQVWGTGKPRLTLEGTNNNAGLYLLYRQAFLTGCSPKVSGSPSSDFAYKDVRIIADSGTDSTKTYEGVSRSDSRNIYKSSSSSTESKNCGEIADLVNKYAKDFKAYLAVTPTDTGTATGTTANGCADSNAAATDPNCTSTENKSSCKVDGIGWMLCPVANAMAGMTDAAFGAVTAFMNVAPLNLSSTDDPLYVAWATMRTIANVAFVVVFLIVIFSQLSSVGVSNYGVKKLLPRLVVAAILVNLSFYICAIAVDISNILGVGVQQLFITIAESSSNSSTTTSETWGSITSAVLGGGTAAVVGGVALSVFTSGGVLGALAGLLPLLVGALLALIIAFLVLLARQALIIMLIVLAPLAFVAYLLPNTESLFKKWRDLFISLLVLFPMLAIVFGASNLASVILRASSGALLTPTADNATKITAFFLYIGSFAVQAIPLFITPLLIKLSGGVLGRFAGMVNNPNKGPFDRLRKGSERMAKDAQNRGFANKVGKEGFTGFGARRRARVSRISSGLEGSAKYNENEYINSQLSKTDANGNSKLATRMAAGDEKAGASISAKAIASTEQEHLKESMQPLLRKLSTLDPDDKRDHLEKEINDGNAPGGDHSRASAALHYAAQIGDTDFLRKQMAKGGETERMGREAINANPGAILGKAPDLIKGAKGAFGSLKGSDLVQFKPDTAEALVTHMKGLTDRAAVANTQVGTAQYTSDPVFKKEVDKAISDHQTAVNGLNSAIDDISRSPELQGQFSGDVGTRIVHEVSKVTTSTGNNDFENQFGGLAGIQSDGKIR